MLLGVYIEIALLAVVVCETIAPEQKPYAIFPVPFELPNRNDRSEQCWLRIEDLEIVDTVSVYCYIAQAYLRNYIYEYNTRKMKEDKVDLSAWNEDREMPENPLANSNPKSIIDWRTTTVYDPTINRRIYVSKKAYCKLIMYSREGMTNYKVNCESVLNFINNSASKGMRNNYSNSKITLVLAAILFFVIY